MEFIKENKHQIFWLSALTFLLWYRILGQTFLGEAYYYFDKEQFFILTDGRLADIFAYDSLAKIIFDILRPIFTSHITPYLGFQMGVIIILNIILFRVVKNITNSKMIGFFAAFFFLTSYMSSYEMIAIGNYQRFVQRVPNLIPLLFSFEFLHKYLKNFDRKYFRISFFLYCLSIFLAHFSVFLMPIFVIYPIIHAILSQPTAKKLLNAAFLSLLFFAAAMLITSLDPHQPDLSLFQFIKSDPRIFQKILILQTNTTVPPFILQQIVKLSKSIETYGIVMAIVGGILFFVFSVIGLRMFKLPKNQKSISVLYCTMLVALPAFHFLNLWTYQANINPLTQIGESRFYYIPSIALSTLLAILCSFVFKSRYRFVHLLLVIFIVSATLHNMFLINRDIAAIQYKSEAMKQYVSHIKSLVKTIEPDSAIVTPTSLQWPGSFIEYLTDYKTIKFISYDETWESKAGLVDKNKVFVFDYDYKNMRLIDLTQRYRSGEKIDYIR